MFGTRTEFLGEVGPEQTEIRPGDAREALISGGLSSRTRAVADILLEELRSQGKDPATARIYGHEAVTHFAALARRRFPCFLGTEYAPSEEARRRLLPFIHNDVCDSQFPDDSFDATFSCDVLEHVHDRDAALRESARTTVRGGLFLATFPFFFDMEVGSIFAEVVDGALVHHLESPIYHGNPMDEQGGALVFEIPGWDILERARQAGFGQAAIRFICDEEKGVTASGEGRPDGPRGVFVLVARK
jgi:SAM-dependent methyltransferase